MFLANERKKKGTFRNARLLLITEKQRNDFPSNQKIERNSPKCCYVFA